MASNGSHHLSNQSMNLHQTGPAGDEKSPRPPKSDTESRVLNIIKNNERAPVQERNHPSQEPFRLPVVTSTLSADAQEFVPRAQTVYQESFYGDPSANLSASAAEFYPGAADDYNYNDYYQNSDYDQNYLADSFGNMALSHGGYHTGSNPRQSSTGDPVLDKFNETLYILNTHPANMEEYLRPICELIQSGQAKNTNVGNMVESLFEQGIQEANFRYTGARICQYLSTHLKEAHQFDGFHKTLIRRCQEDFNKRNEFLNGTPAERERLRGLAMFMGEIFLNVQIEQADGTPVRLKFLPGILMDLAQCVMTKPNDLNIKCVCQLFKLSGALIEDEVKLNPDECIKFENIFLDLQSLKESPNVTEDAKFRLTSLVNLKEANWNRNMSSPPKKSNEFNSDLNSFQGQEPVFYNNFGETCSRQEANLPEEEYNDNFHVLTEEEEEAFKQFEEESNKLVGDDTGYDSCNLGDGDMGEEAEAAYEEFLQEQFHMLQQQQQQQQQMNHHHNNMYQHQPQPAPPSFNQHHQMPPGMMQPPHGYFEYNPQQPPPSHSYHHQQIYPHQDHQFAGHMAPQGMVPPQQMHQMNLQHHQQLQYQQQQSQSPQQQHQQRPPYNYPNQ